MGRKCSVKSCTSQSAKPEHAGVTYHKIPLHPDVRPKWLSLCRIPTEKMESKMLFVCSRHFLRADFCNFKGKKYMLKQGVLPSVFPWDKSRLEAIKAVVGSKKDEDEVSIKTKALKKEPTENDTLGTESATEASDVDDKLNEIKTEFADIKEDQEGKTESGSTIEPERSTTGNLFILRYLAKYGNQIKDSDNFFNLFYLQLVINE